MFFAAIHSLELTAENLVHAVADFIRNRGQPRVMVVAPDKVDEGLEAFARHHGLKLVAAPVGDAWVLSNLEDHVLHDPAVALMPLDAEVASPSPEPAAAPSPAPVETIATLVAVIAPENVHPETPVSPPEPVVLPSVFTGPLDDDIDHNPLMQELKAKPGA